MDPDPPLSYSLAFSQFAAALALEPTVLVILAVIFVFLLFASALFSGSEVALFSLDATDQELLAEADDRASRRVLALLRQPRQLLITILLLNTVVNVSAAIIAALITHAVADSLALPEIVILILEVFVLTFVLLVVSEITPKLIATQHAARFSRHVSGPLMLLHRMFWPLSSLMARSMRFVQGRFKTTAQRISQEDLKAMAEIGSAHGTLEEEERELINSIVEFGDTSVRAIMVSRLDIVALPVTSTLAEALDIIRQHGHSRVPLYVEHLDNILGVVYAKDLLPYLKQNGNGLSRVDWTRLARPPMFVPLGRKLDDLLKDFQRKKTHLAIVVDEYGGTAGLVTLEDVLEEIVGDIRDEHDEPEEKLYEQIDAHTYRVDARLDLDDLNTLLDLDLDTETFDFETVGGLIFHVAADIPSVGDEMAYGPLTLRVESVDNNRIGIVYVHAEPPVQEETLNGDADEHPQ